MILRVVVFGSGAILMGLEIVGSRLLAPYFGSSVYVWGSLISIFLGALSLGYYGGGIASDRWPKASVLASVLLAAGLLVLMLPAASKPILEAFATWDLGPRLSPLLASVVLFAAPSILMGATSPFAVKLAATDLATVGNVAGLLYAVSTAGSIAGTLLTAFVLIPALGVRSILYILGFSLAAISSLLLLRVGVPRPARSYARLTVVLAVVLAALVMASPGWSAPVAERILYEKDSVYHRIIVRDHGNVRWLHFDNSNQGGMYLDDPFVSPLLYTDYVHLAWIFHPAIKRVLVVGLGAGTIPKRFWRDYPEVVVDAVELDPAVVDVAKRFFSIKEDARLRIAVQDGRQFVRRSDEKYDLIVMDAYYAQGIPFHLVTKEFFETARAHLTPNGIIAANIVGALEGRQSKLFRAIYKTYGAVYPGIYPFPVGAPLAPREGESVGTIILIAAQKAGMTRAQISEAGRKLKLSRKVKFPLYDRFVGDFYDRPIPTSDVPLLTDDYAPVDILPVYGWEPERR